MRHCSDGGGTRSHHRAASRGAEARTRRAHAPGKRSGRGTSHLHRSVSVTCERRRHQLEGLQPRRQQLPTTPRTHSKEPAIATSQVRRSGASAPSVRLPAPAAPTKATSDCDCAPHLTFRTRPRGICSSSGPTGHPAQQSCRPSKSRRPPRTRGTRSHRRGSHAALFGKSSRTSRAHAAPSRSTCKSCPSVACHTRNPQATVAAALVPRRLSAWQHRQRTNRPVQAGRTWAARLSRPTERARDTRSARLSRRQTNAFATQAFEESCALLTRDPHAGLAGRSRQRRRRKRRCTERRGALGGGEGLTAIRRVATTAQSGTCARLPRRAIVHRNAAAGAAHARI